MIEKCVWALACLLAVGGIAQAQTRTDKGKAEFVLLAMASAEECIAADALLRKSCALVGRHLSDSNRKYCELPATSFEARTARDYAAFKETYRVEIKESEADFAKLMRRLNRNFERRFAEMRAGKISMLDLESLSGLLNDRCQTIEREWLAPNRKPR
jgi:hypothetical protein